jgi:hypothetical protein
VLEVRLSCDQSFDYRVFDSAPVLVSWQAMAFQGLEKLRQRFLVAVAEVFQ